MKACREWEQAIVEYVDGVCAPAVAHELESHLSRCAACAEVVKTQRWLKSALAQLGREHAPAYLTRRIRDHARVALRQRPRARAAVRLAWATAFCVVAIGWWAVSRFRATPTSPAQEPTVAQAIVLEYVGATANDAFADPSLQLLAQEAHAKTLRLEPTSP